MITVEVNLNDFYQEESESLNETIINSITSSVVAEVKKRIAQQVEERITAKIVEKVEYWLDGKISEEVDRLIDRGTIKRRGAAEPVSLQSYIEDQFNNGHGWGRPEAKIEKIAKAFGENLKLQYNNMFANKIVQSMKEQGLLKDEVVQLLLDPKHN